MLISDNLPVRKSYFDSNIFARILRRFILRIILKRTSTEAHVYMRRHQDAKVISNVIYHKFSHGAVSYTLKGGNVKVMLEYRILPVMSDLTSGVSMMSLRHYLPAEIYHEALFPTQYFPLMF